jgi:GNAT superfamily N-acetyltransferase
MFHITHVTPKDIPDLQDMLQKLCAFHGDTCMRGLEDIQAQFIDGPLVGLIVRKSGQAIGFATLVTHWRPMNDGDSIDILHLYVKEHMRARGIGRRLIAAAQDHARAQSATRLTIGTSPDNPGAAAAYRAMGWDEITSQPGPRFQIRLGPA